MWLELGLLLFCVHTTTQVCVVYSEGVLKKMFAKEEKRWRWGDVAVRWFFILVR